MSDFDFMICDKITGKRHAVNRGAEKYRLFLPEVD